MKAKKVGRSIKGLSTLDDFLAEAGKLEEFEAVAIKEVLAACGLKMPHLAMPVRVLVAGTAHTPSVDAMLSLFDRQKVLERLQQA